MNLQQVALLFLCCVCDISSTVRIVANQATQSPGDCNLSQCPAQPCTHVIFSEKDFRCIFLDCDNDTSCDLSVAELGGKTQKEETNQKNQTHPLQTPSPSLKTAPLASTTTTAAPSPAPVSQLVDSRNSSDSSFSNNTSDSFPPQKGQNGVLEQALNSSSKDGAQKTTPQNGHKVHPPIRSFTPAPTTPPDSLASEGAGNISSTTTKKQNGTPLKKTDPTTTSITSSTSTTNFTSSNTTTNFTSSNTTNNFTSSTTTNFTSSNTTNNFTSSNTTTTSDTPALPTNSTTENTTTFTSTTVSLITTSTTNKVPSPPSTTQKQPTTIPPPTPAPPPPSSTTPTSLPSVTPSTPPPGQNPSTSSSRVPDVTSYQDRDNEGTAGGELKSHFINTNSLIAVLIFGLLFFIVTVLLFLRHAYESYKRRGYTQMDYLINGMYSDSGL
ncbi:cell wall integrity and stress response component 3 [Tachysurus fulvidraco]|uniref:cell wall integrity and stress response component 3 n=1 Tax=Tachysurus fulvidraco TaxID=1234273 RepID=UPI001FEF4094|nr:cell wall integrity and stress response component 3 [Tachysurus fulvidraco]XP_027016741.2 cell wall integrity and stress response component 3 [Tachysurus fulvidraco]XP_047658526.1 cell wall integrity and stress response component 3 [Tachysurus fulvidraco]